MNRITVGITSIVVLLLSACALQFPVNLNTKPAPEGEYFLFLKSWEFHGNSVRLGGEYSERMVRNAGLEADFHFAAPSCDSQQLLENLNAALDSWVFIVNEPNKSGVNEVSILSMEGDPLPHKDCFTIAASGVYNHQLATPTPSPETRNRILDEGQEGSSGQHEATLTAFEVIPEDGIVALDLKFENYGQTFWYRYDSLDGEFCGAQHLVNWLRNHLNKKIWVDYTPQPFGWFILNSEQEDYMQWNLLNCQLLTKGERPQ